jgi:subtilisin family serine protease
MSSRPARSPTTTRLTISATIDSPRSPPPGPTYEGFVKPEVIAPGGHMVASMSSQSYLANIDPGSMAPTAQMFTMSGTSMAAAVTTGVVALMLQSDPTLAPDDVKCRLLASARPAVTSAARSPTASSSKAPDSSTPCRR